jgi:apolipoprotein N-acyltransferase
VSIARAANTGISGFIDPYGRILAQSDIFVEGTLVHQIPLRNTTTFYTRYGDLFARLCLILLIVGIGYGYVKR